MRIIYLHVIIVLPSIFVWMCVCVTAELGDYDEELDCHHLEMKQYVPNQEYLDHKIIKFHKKHRYTEKLKRWSECSVVVLNVFSCQTEAFVHHRSPVSL